MLSPESSLERDPAEPEVSPCTPSVRSGISPVEAPRTPHPSKFLRSGTDLGRLLAGKYVVLDWIGRGGMADVILARDVESARIVAVKLLAKELRSSSPHRQRMVREGALAQAVCHPNVVTTLDAGQLEDGTPFLVLEPLVGETLHEHLGRHRRMSAARALPLLRQLAEGLAAVHQAGIVHGDLKPRNVFLCGPTDAPTGVKIIDFGLARTVAPGAVELGDEDELVAGTFEYLSPEQAVADPLDERADIYSFGVVAFRWLTGELPFDTHLGTQLLVHQLTSPAPPMSWLAADIEPALDALVAVALRKAKENRYRSMFDLLMDLEAIAEGERVIQGAPVVVYPDSYEPENELGRRALKMLIEADHERLSQPRVSSPLIT
jgi:eukaryotic-like serine/threonine-protein kinase